MGCGPGSAGNSNDKKRTEPDSAATICHLNLLSADDWLQIEQGASGCISGISDEWPLLVAAIEKVMNRKLPRRSSAWLRGYCEALIAARDIYRAAQLAARKLETRGGQNVPDSAGAYRTLHDAFSRIR